MNSGKEIFEIVDEGGKVIGTAPREECHRNPDLIHRAVHVMVLDGEGRIYLQKRAGNKDIQPGRWDSSVGGHLIPGEEYAAAAEREMLEELNIKGTPRFLYRHRWSTEKETEMVETYLLVTGSEPKIEPGEIEEGRFFSAAEIREMIGSGLLTPNFEEEFRRLGVAGLL